MLKRKNSRWRHVFHFLIVLPLILFLYSSVLSAAPAIVSPPVPLSLFLIAFAISTLSYITSSALRKRLYIPEDIPANTSMFVSDLLLMPFMFLYQQSIGGAAALLFMLLELSIIVAASILVIVGVTLKRSDFPKLDNSAVFVAGLAMVITFAILSTPFMIFGIFFGIGISFCYLSLYGFFATLIYLVQMLSRRDRFTAKDLSNYI